MENENTKRLIQLEQRFARLEAEIKELKKLSGQNRGANAVVAVSNCEMDDGSVEEKDEDEDATIYFCVGDLVCDTNRQLVREVTWFAIPPRGVVNSEGHINPLFKGPHLDEVFFVCLPLAVGPYIFLISNVVDEKPFLKRRVLYINMHKEEKEWKEASSVFGKYAEDFYFVVANDNIYSFGPDDDGSSLRVSILDSQNPVEEWHLVKGRTCGPLRRFSFFITASTIEYDTSTTMKGKTGKIARRALLFARNGCISYNFETETYDFSEDCLFCNPYCGLCPDGGDIFFLVPSFDHSSNIKAYDPHVREWCKTPVIGLDMYLPVPFSDHRLPHWRLVRLGNRRMCLVWTIFDGANMHVHCTKFSVTVQEGGFRAATKVSSQVFKVKVSRQTNVFEAVAV